MKYNFWTGVKKVLINLVIIAVPMLIELLPVEWMNMTFSGLVLLGLNWLKVSQGFKI